MPTPDFVLQLRAKIGTDPLWLSGVTAVVLRESDGVPEVLLGRRSDNGRVAPISGIIDPGEHPAVAAEREILEEAGVVAVAESLVWVRTTPEIVYDNGDRTQYLDLVFRCRYVSGDPHPADGEASEVFWRRLDDLGDLEGRMRDAVLHAAAGGDAARFERG